MRPIGPGGHDLDDAIAARFELAQQLRQHQSGGGLNVVQQQDALVLLFEPLQRAVKHLLTADMGPIVSHDVGAPRHDAV